MNAKAKQVGGAHYKAYAIQPIEFIQANEIPYAEACVIKYVCRHAGKGGKQDLLKAIHYLELAIEHYYPDEVECTKSTADFVAFHNAMLTKG